MVPEVVPAISHVLSGPMYQRIVMAGTGPWALWHAGERMRYSVPACRSVEEAMRQGSRRQDMKTRFLAQAAICVALLGTSMLPAAIPASAAATTPGNTDPWPRTLHVGNGTLTVYQPQVDSWDG